MSFAGKNILITGINGFVGTAAARSFVEEGAHVVGIVKDLNRKTDMWIERNCSIISGDIRDFDLLRYATSHYEIDYVLHLASQAIVKICHSDPYTAYETNIMGVVNVLEAARIQNIPPQKIIVMTSDKYYGTAPPPYTEDLPPGVADTYCTSKTCQDMIARSYALTYEVPAITVRAGNIYGPGDFNMSRLVPKSIIKLYQGDSPVLYKHAAKMVREFLYIDDVIDAFKILFTGGITGESYNIGGTGPVKIEEVMDAIREIVNPEIPIVLEEIGFYEINEQYLDATKLKALGWNPKFSLKQGLEKSFEFYKGAVDTGYVRL
ncbi:MAG: NAD-dependent epimerase/dehydratase family protein [Candidatus Peribacteraceae bacterium]|nr:NAD-dependent epimerase/dehydratase family protein [Candidatus Peribacteraceae bacterium]